MTTVKHASSMLIKAKQIGRKKSKHKYIAATNLLRYLPIDRNQNSAKWIRCEEIKHWAVEQATSKQH